MFQLSSFFMHFEGIVEEIVKSSGELVCTNLGKSKKHYIFLVFPRHYGCIKNV